MKTDHIGRAD